MKTLGLVLSLFALWVGILVLPAQDVVLVEKIAWLPGGSVGFWGMNGGNPGADTRWQEPLRNLLLQSEDMTAAGWTATGSGTVNDATHFTFVAQNDYVSQSITPATGLSVTLYVRARAVTGNTSLHLYHGGLTPDSTVKTLTGTLADYVATVTTDGGAILFGFQDQNAAGFGQIEVTRWAVIPGTHTAAGAAALYRKTATQQTIWDFSGTGVHGVRGADANAGADDPTYTLTSRNLLAAGSTEDLTHAAWATGITNGSVVDGDTFNITSVAGNPVIRQTVNNATSILVMAGATYTLRWQHQDGTATGVKWAVYDVSNSAFIAVDQSYGAHVTWTDVEYTFQAPVGCAAIWIFAVRGAVSIGTVDLRKFQLEVSSAATPYTNPVTESRPVLAFDGTNDIANATVTLSGDKTFLFLVRPTAFTKGLFRNGASSPNVSIDANGKIAWAGASTITATNALNLGAWNIAAITISGTTVTHYLNGAANGSGTSASGNDLTALRWGTNGTTFLTGAAGPFIVWPRALSAAQIVGDGDGLDAVADGASGYLTRMWWEYTGRCAAGAASAYCQSAPLYLADLAPERFMQLAMVWFHPTIPYHVPR